MGNGIIMKCPECDKEYDLLLGEGMLSVALNVKYNLYICPICFSWKHKKENNPEVIKMEKITKLIHSINKKEFEKNYEEIKSNQIKQKCQKCKSIMNLYDYLYRKKDGNYVLTQYKYINDIRHTLYLTDEQESVLHFPTMKCNYCGSELELQSHYLWD